MIGTESKDDLARSKLIAGIAAYNYEQRLLIRLLKKRGSFTDKEFDKWFRGRELRHRPRLMPPIHGDSFILGLGVNGGNRWAMMLELMQIMVNLGIIDAKSKHGMVVYSLRDAGGDE